MFVRLRIGLSAAALGAGLVVLSLCAGAATASTLVTLHGFCSSAGCSDGNGPSGAQVRDGAGNLYGTTVHGGAEGCDTGCGVVYRIAPTGRKKAFKVIHKFCSTGSCENGGGPESNLIIDVSGNLYGISHWGQYSEGAIYKVSSSGKKYVLLHSFCAEANCTDGKIYPYLGQGLTYQGAASGAPYDGISPLYGLTNEGGINSGGVVFELTHHKNVWTYTVLYSFCSQPKCADGDIPNGLVADTSGNLYGTTAAGGDNKSGTVFKLAGGAFQRLYSFCAQSKCHDGSIPEGLTIDAQGNLFGATATGGNASVGVLFKIDTSGVESKLYDFCTLDNCADGAKPLAPPVIDAQGNLFGTAQYGGKNNMGVLYKFDGTTHILYDFCSVSDGTCSDGATPRAPLIMDGAGNLYGATAAGASGFGTVFKFTP